MIHQPINTLLLLLLVAITSDAFVVIPQQQLSSSSSSLLQSRSQPAQQRSMALHSSDPTSAITTETSEDDDEDDEDDEYEYEEYDFLEESDFTGSEWLVGSCMDSSPNRIDETWVRLAVDPKDGKQLAIWGDNSEGTWKFDKASQFLTMSKNNILGKKIWAGVVDDFYFTLGTVRGWSFFSAAAVVGQWQAKRLGVDPEEAGAAPWFEPQEEEESPNGDLPEASSEQTE
mmetsp:Transcript_35162/g.85164  ORF Transcript_35162/g.85164 Transcript_35162/m.85164 type:complete len:229 (+) Transcript_35162:160-846(+)|eukprot:CAMPEP_0113614432 /NCGR_PEP_ID=MMETSP0017_2-20120614/7164_1 /TAXON_ID=2856 /ORGANISM="Cylindrotheca closterium" /LENGTH=228 /DNA_ID=CAMNT_0000523601 /DNA_START=160 /DNA_END=846 /DNA_ORIENTATION=+ /assembly_acc=CAM_ASM_000147